MFHCIVPQNLSVYASRSNGFEAQLIKTFPFIVSKPLSEIISLTIITHIQFPNTPYSNVYLCIY